MLKHKKNVDSKDVYDTKKYICYERLLTIYNTKKCVYLKNNKSWLKDVRKEKRCWIIFKLNLNQI